MITISTLEHISVDTIVTAFNTAFADYQFNMQQSVASMTDKIFRERIDLSLSVGAFDGDIMVGFILFGIGDYNGIPTAWDGGTGVLAAYRGQQLTKQMFGYIEPLLKTAGIKKLLLEVLQGNDAAYSIYQKTGFKVTRELLAYRGTIKASETKHTIEILDNYDADELLALGDWHPCWQQTNEVVRNWGANVLTIGIKQGGNIIAYAHYNKETKRVLQFAVSESYRRQGMATDMFSYLSAQSTEPIVAINIDGNSKNTNGFLRAIGFEQFASQYEMERLF